MKKSFDAVAFQRKVRRKSSRETGKKFLRDHPFFGMWKDDKRSVEEIMDELRGGRYRDLFDGQQT